MIYAILWVIAFSALVSYVPGLAALFVTATVLVGLAKCI